MAKFGCPPKFIAMVWQFHDECRHVLRTMESTMDHFLTPTELFSMMSSAMLTDAFQECDACFPIRYRFDGKLNNLRSLQAKSKL